MLEGNPWDKGTKTRVKEWVKDNVGGRGSDIILWGRWKHCDEEGEGEEAIRRKTGGEGPKGRNPPTSRNSQFHPNLTYMLNLDISYQNNQIYQNGQNLQFLQNLHQNHQIQLNRENYQIH